MPARNVHLMYVITCLPQLTSFFFSCSAACGILPDQGSNPCPLHWQADSQPLRHQGSPPLLTFKSKTHFFFLINLGKKSFKLQKGVKTESWLKAKRKVSSSVCFTNTPFSRPESLIYQFSYFRKSSNLH